MSDYIDRQELLKKYSKNIFTAQTDYAQGCRDVIDDIGDATTVDAVEVVRCKDCKWYQSVYGACSKFSFKNGNNYNEYCAVVEEDGFCKWGEKE